MLARTFCAATFGVDAHLIDVETNAVNGLPKYYLVGLPDRAVSESRDRIEAAIRNSGYEMPRGRITVNLAPASIPKEGSAFDLPIAVGLLAMSRQIASGRLHHTVMMGELALDGTLRPARGVLPVTVEAKNKGFAHMVVPQGNAAEAAVVQGIKVYGFEHLKEVIGWLSGNNGTLPARVDIQSLFGQRSLDDTPDYRDVRGQENVKRAMEIAAAGGHNMVMIGSPGSGKTMIAKRLPSILPPLTLEEALETTRIHSVAGVLKAGSSLVVQRPFRDPHHSISDYALVGGGRVPKPGEISLAHNGVLFLDELPEFRRSALEALRQPLEEGSVQLSRLRISLRYPARFMLVASMNPSVDGDWYDPDRPDRVSLQEVQQYMGRISGPLMDRIDMHVEVHQVSFDELSDKAPSESSEVISKRVMKARSVQKTRFASCNGIFCNAHMGVNLVRKYCMPDTRGRSLLKKAMSHLSLSARAYERILKVSRTIADLEGSAAIRSHHVAEAVQYRSLDREQWS